MRCIQWGAIVLTGWILLSTAVATDEVRKPAKPGLSLTLIPPSPVTDQIELDVRGAVWNHTATPQSFDLTVYLDDENVASVLYHKKVNVAAGTAEGIQFRWPTASHAGKHRIIIVGRNGLETQRTERPIEILASKIRSTQRLGGAWVDIYHHTEDEGSYFNKELARMTGPQWRQLVRSMHDVQMDVLVITMMFQNLMHYGKHNIEHDGYHGKAYYPSKLFPGRMPIACPDPLEEILSEADRWGMQVLPGIGCYAFFDFGQGSLEWHKKVAREIWERYGHHPSFYGWYVSEEKDGGLGSAKEREELATFFREFTPFVRRMAPDKPVLLATNCYNLRGAEAAYRQLLPHLDILAPFAFHRMPPGDLTGEEAAALLTQLCDQAGCHLWMDLETFVFRQGGALYPRPIGGLISDIRRFPSFEKVLCYQFPGLMSGPGMTCQPGGEPSVKLYLDYQRYLKEGPEAFEIRHAAKGKPVSLEHPCNSAYRGGGDHALTDGHRAGLDYRDPAWQGFWQDDLVATIDLEQPIAINRILLRCLQQTTAGIYLPTEVRFEVSSDGHGFRAVGTVRHQVPLEQAEPLIHRFVLDLPAAKARFVRVFARNIGQIPPGHKAEGQKAWLFADELAVNPVPLRQK